MARTQEYVKRLGYVGLTRLGRTVGLSRRPAAREGDTLRVLMYHKVTDRRPNSIAVGTAAFAEQQGFLQEYYKVVSLDAVRSWLSEGTPLPPRAVLLTFDDGYFDNLENAYPILHRYSHPAVLFVPTSFVGSAEPLPHDRGLPVSNPTVTWSELRDMLDIFAVGSHGRTHRVLTALPPPEARSEIARSKQELEENLGVTVRAFSYPKGSIGDFSPRVEEYVAEAGYDMAFATLPGINRPGRSNPLALRRHNVEDYGLGFFRALLDGSGDLLALKDTRAGYRLKQLVGARR